MVECELRRDESLANSEGFVYPAITQKEKAQSTLTVDIGLLKVATIASNLR